MTDDIIQESEPETEEEAQEEDADILDEQETPEEGPDFDKDEMIQEDG